MKNKSSSIKLKVFGYFAAFTAIMLVLLWLLQTVFLQQIYQHIKISSVKDCAHSVVENMDESYVEGLAERYDVCIRIFDGTIMDVTDACVSPTCIVHRLTYPLILQIYQTTEEAGGEKLLNITPVYQEGILDEFGKIQLKRRDAGIETIIFSVITDGKLLLIESTISPVGATVDTLKMELYFVSGILLVLAFVLALILSRRTAKPIEKLNDSAKLLAQGDYDIDFTTKGYREVEELGETLNYAEVELSKVENLRRELLANISHDLRTPLTMITGYAEVVRDIPGEQTPENMQVIIDESTRLTSLVNDLLDVSKLQAGAQKLEKEVFDLTSAVSQTLTRYQKLIEQQNYVITFKSQGSAFVYADRAKINQVIYNLVNNAVNYTGEDKCVEISERIVGDNVRIEIKDTGEGIEPEKLKYIWDRYYKLDKSHKRAQIGTGLGLSIVRRVIELHGGKYGVQSTVGEGSVFWFELKLYDENGENADMEENG